MTAEPAVPAPVDADRDLATDRARWAARPDRVYHAVIWFGRVLFRLLGLRRQVSGAEQLPETGGAVLAITHFGYLDFALTEWAVWIARKRLVRFLATAASFRHAMSGPLMRAMGHIPVDRSAGGGAYAAAVRALRAGQLVGVFPEGRVTASWTVLDCRSGAVRLAAEAGVPLLPVTVWGGHRVSTRARILPRPSALGAAVLIDIGPPLHFDPAADVAARTKVLRAALTEQMHTAQQRYPQQPALGRRAWWQPAALGGGAPPSDAESSG